MFKKHLHPSSYLNSLLVERRVSQRELASIIQTTPSVLNLFLQGTKSITAEMAVKLEAAGYGCASDWLKRQAEYDLLVAKDKIKDEANLIGDWNIVQSIIPVSFFKKKGVISSDLDSNVSTILKIYNAETVKDFEKFHDSYTFSHYRKSSAFQEQKNNVIAWSTYAEYIVKDLNVKKFDILKKDELVYKLNRLFFKNPRTLLTDTKNLLASYGVKFETLDRPSKTPVDGKSFISNNSPAIVLSLKYKRLDNFAFTVMHELGHVFLHLSNKEYKDESFYINNSQNSILEFEANEFARNSLIPKNIWEDFEYRNSVFSDECILNLSVENKIHPAIIRGRVCFEHNNYYRRRSSITETNKITFE